VDARFQGLSTSIYSAFPVFVKNDSGIRYLRDAAVASSFRVLSELRPRLWELSLCT
jgi:hypothetical protein